MARPPIARRAPYTAGEPPSGLQNVDVLPTTFSGFMARQRELAAAELGFPVVDDDNARGDLGDTVMEMSALVAHVLGLYQGHYGNEAFLGTARAPSSLVKHGRRLAYEPAPGVSASGYVALFAKPGLAGRIPERFAFSSSAEGEKPAQSYELTEPAEIDARLNELRPIARREPITGGPFPLSLNELAVAGVELELALGDVVVIAWRLPSGEVAHARRVTSLSSDAAARETRVGLSSSVQVPAQALQIRLLARPALDLHAFAHDAPAILDGATSYAAPSGVSIKDVFLEREVDVALVAQPIVRVDASSVLALRLSVDAAGPQQASVNVRLRHVSDASVVVDDEPNKRTITYNLAPEVVYARTVTRVVLRDAATNALVDRPAVVDRTRRYLSDWQLTLDVRTWRPSESLVASPLVLEGEHDSLLPGRLLALESTGEGAFYSPSRIVRVLSSTPSAGATTVHFGLVDPTQSLGPLRLGYLRVLGNIGRVTHGKTVNEILGDSDGVSAFQRLVLAKTPVAHAATRDGAEPQLEVRVGGTLFRRALDFTDYGPTDAVYLTERSADGVVSILFGDGKRGAVPPSGKRHVQASYRQGSGELGNTAAQTVSKITKAHPLLERAYNPAPITGGIEPASAEEVRTEAPLYLATFDRAVSVADHAKLALRVPGVVRARSFLGEVQAGTEGVVVVIADRFGQASNVEAVAAFLRDRRDNTLPFKVVAPSTVDVTLTLGVMFDAAFDEEQVKLAIRALLTSSSKEAPGQLTFAARDLGQPLFKSQVVEWLERLEGVTGFRLQAFSVKSGATNPPGPAPLVLDTIRAEPTEWVRLQPGDLSIVKLSELL